MQIFIQDKNKDLSFHRFPEDLDSLLEKGGPIFVKGMTINAETALICSKHFEAEAYEKGLKYELLGEPVPKTHIKDKA